MSEPFPAPTPHGALEELFPDVFIVRGSYVYTQYKMALTRTMTVVRQGGGLTLLNSVRLDDAGEAALTALGTVEHVVKLGSFHGLDDPYYVDRFGATLWAPPGATHKRGLATDRELGEDACPIAGATLFLFRTTRLPEAAIRIEAGGGTLLACDAVTNLIDLDGSSGVEAVVTRENGFLRPASIGGMWRSSMTKEHGPSLILDYQRLLELPFHNLISGHGPPLLGTAPADLRATLRSVFGAKV